MIRFLLTLIAANCATAALADEPFKVPDGYSLQILEPTGGKIARPNGWFYDERNTPNGYLWTISREDPRKGAYLVGEHIQVLMKVQETGKISAPAFIETFIAGRKQAAARVLSECTTSVPGIFQRRCLETEEVLPADGGPKRFHIQDSLFWANDVAVVATFGAPVEEWAGVQHVAKAMATFEIIDMSRFAK
jgi:hypothetical protein